MWETTASARLPPAESPPRMIWPSKYWLDELQIIWYSYIRRFVPFSDKVLKALCPPDILDGVFNLRSET